MGISDEMEFVTIAIYETMSLEIKATIVWIAIPIKFDNVSVHWRQSNMPKSVPAAYSEFLFDNIWNLFLSLFEILFPLLSSVAPPSLPAGLLVWPHKLILDMQ